MTIQRALNHARIDLNELVGKQVKLQIHVERLIAENKISQRAELKNTKIQLTKVDIQVREATRKFNNLLCQCG